MAHPDAATTNGYTPLHISAREGQVDVASVLLEAGAAHSLATKVRGQLRERKCQVQAVLNCRSFRRGKTSARPPTCVFLKLFRL